MWTIENTWDEIIERLETLENFELPYKNTLLLKNNSAKVANGESHWITYEKDEPVRFSYSIENLYPSVIIWFSTGGHTHYQAQNIISACVAKYKTGHFDGNHKNIFASKKEAMVFILNEWEQYVETKQYAKDYEDFTNYCKELCLIGALR